MSAEEAPVSAKNLIKGYEKGEAFKPGEVKSSEKAEINEPVAKNLISSFESGKVYTKGELPTEKPDIHEPLAKNLISSFEKGGVTSKTDVKSEKPVSRPGAAKNLQKVYESIDKDARSETAQLSPAANDQQPQANDEPNAAMTSKAADAETTAKLQTGKPAAQSMETNNKKTVLLVLAHWKRTSFNGALHDVAERTLIDQGYNVIVSDLYAMGWNPVISHGDLGGKGHASIIHSNLITMCSSYRLHSIAHCQWNTL